MHFEHLKKRCLHWHAWQNYLLIISKLLPMLSLLLFLVIISIIIITLTLFICLFYPYFYAILVVSILPRYIIEVEPCTSCTSNDLVPCSLFHRIEPQNEICAKKYCELIAVVVEILSHVLHKSSSYVQLKFLGQWLFTR